MIKAPLTPICLSGCLILAACGEGHSSPEIWEDSGEIIALGGGDAGARGACATCHGLNGEGDGNLVPRLAGLNAGYFARQMEYFAEGQRRHPQMAWIAGRLDWSARQKVAVYYSEMTVPQGPREADGEADCGTIELYQQGDPARGLPSCASCHGEDGAGVGQGNPPLAQQPAPYLEKQLKLWAEGERYGDPNNAMTRISRLLTEDEMTGLANYSSALPGTDVHRGSQETCLPARRPDPRNGV